MPIWLQVFLSVAAGLTTVCVIWNAVHAARLNVSVGNVLCLLKELDVHFRQELDGVLSHLDNTTKEGRAAAEVLKEGVESARLLAQLGGDQIQQILVNLARVGAVMDAGAATAARIEEHASGVAADLSDAHARADKAGHEGEPGAAADAAAQQTSKEKRGED